jgi:hypothetical protein
VQDRRAWPDSRSHRSGSDTRTSLADFQPALRSRSQMARCLLTLQPPIIGIQEADCNPPFARAAFPLDLFRIPRHSWTGLQSLPNILTKLLEIPDLQPVLL